MKAAAFAYVRAASVHDAIETLREHGGGARVLAGGQSLVPMLNMRLARPTAVVDVNGIAELGGIREQDGDVVLGALTRYADVVASPLVAQRLPLLGEAIGHVGDPQVRNRGTVGGSLAQADPTGELPLACLVLGATVVVAGPGGERRLTVEQLLDGAYATTLADDELVTSVRFPPAPTAHAFRERTRRHNDFAIVAVAAVASPQPDGSFRDVRIGLTGADETPRTFGDAAARAEGTALDAATIAGVAQACFEAADPPSDARAAADYRRALVREDVRWALERLRATRDGVHHGA